MIDTSWRVEDGEPDNGSAAVASPSLVSLHFLRSALRRRWKVWVSIAVACMLLGAAWNVVVPAKGVGTVTLLLSHDPATDATTAMETDISLLRTRTVAQSVIDDLGLPVTTEELQATITATDVTPTVLVIDVAAPDDASALTRVRALSKAYLAFRGTQLESQSNALIDGYQEQIDGLKKQASDLTQKYNALSAAGPERQSEATEALTERSSVGAEIGRLQQLVEDTALQSHAIVEASHELDPPSTVPRSTLRRLVLTVGSGLIGGLALGIGLVLFQALTSTRLRRREEVALALAAPVRVSAGRIRRGTPWRRRGRRSAREVDVLVHGLESAVTPRKGRRVALGVLAVDDSQDAALVVSTLAVRLAVTGRSVFLVDLSRGGRLGRTVARAMARARHEVGPREPEVFRPEREPVLARGPLATSPAAWSALPEDHPSRAAWDAADVVLTLGEVDPAVGVDHLATWVTRVVLLVAAGRSSAERLRTVGELVRASGLDLAFAMMLEADPTDESSGLVAQPEPGWSGEGRQQGRTSSGKGRL